MRVRTKLRILFLLVIGLALITGGVSLWSIDRLGEALGASNSSLGTQLRAERLRTLIGEGANEERILAVVTPRDERPPGGADADERFAAFRREFTGILDELATAAHGDADLAALIGRVRSSLEHLVRYVEYGKVSMESRGEWRKTQSYLTRSFFPDLNRFVDELIAGQQERVRVATERARRSERQVVTLILASSVIFLGVATAGFVLFRYWLLLPVITLSGATRRIAEGHYRETIPIGGRNEFARLARDIEAMSRDIADVQEKLIEKERMAAVGEMTASVAHNVRNPLASIRAIAQTCRRDPAATEPLRTSLATVMETVDRADRWLKDLLNALRPVKLAPRPEDLRAVLEDVVRGARPFAERKGVALLLELAEALPEVPLDRRHFEQALIVLISNAVEASAAGASVTIRAGAEPLPGNRVRIEVVDRGVGMDEATLERIFTPYFSTKKSGIGLGLSLARKIVFGHRGTIDVDSEPDRGTRMTLLFPTSSDPAREERRDGPDPDPR